MQNILSHKSRISINPWKIQKVRAIDDVIFSEEKIDLKNTEKALLNILDDYSDEKNHAKDTQTALLNILDDYADEKHQSEDNQRALLNILDDYADEKRKSKEQSVALLVQNTQLADFCNIVSHNLRAPIINIHMLVDLIEQSNEETERKEMLGKIKHVVNHLNEVFNELVESIQIKQDTEIKSDTIVLENCVNKVLKGYESQIRSYGADIQINFDNAPLIIYPQKYIDSIFDNLVSNALKYRSPNRKPVIKIKTEYVNGNILLSVSDNGLGIDLVMHKDSLFKIRKVFHKHPDARGFGLFMTKTQVEAMGGKIWAESTPGKGSTFFIEFKTQNE